MVLKLSYRRIYVNHKTYSKAIKYLFSSDVGPRSGFPDLLAAILDSLLNRHSVVSQSPGNKHNSN